MAISVNDLEIPFYLVLEDDDVQKGLDEVTSKIKKTGKVVENDFIKKFKDAKDQFQAIVKFGNQAYSVLGKLTRKGEINKRAGLKAEALTDKQALDVLNKAKTLAKYQSKIQGIRASENDAKKRKEAQELAKQQALAEKQQALEEKRAQKEDEKEALAKLKLTEAQEAYNNEMQRYIDILNNKQYKSAKEFLGIGADIKKKTGNALKEGLNLDVGAQALGLYNTREAEYQNTLAKMGEIFKGILPPIQIAKMELSYVRDQMKAIAENLLLLGDSEGADELKEKLKKLAKEAEKLEKKTKLSGIQKLFNTFKRVGFYRMFRRLFSFVEQGFSQSLKSLSMFDSGINKSMSQITSSLSVMSSSIIAMIGPILDMLAPIIQQIATGLADIANGFNKANAQAKGLSKYTKVNADYMKDFANESNSALLSFDKFETLSGNDPLAGVYEEGSVADELGGDEAEFGGELYKSLQLVLDIIKKIWDIASPLIDDFLNLINPMLNLVNVLLNYLEPLLMTIFNYIGDFYKYLSGIVDVITGILYILMGDFDKAWEHIGSGFKKMVQGWLDSFVTLLNGVIDLINILFVDMNPLFWILKATGAVPSDVGIPHIPSPKLFANGGTPTKGSLFWAGEAGAEFVTKMPSGQTGVTNITQFKQAMVEALYECSDIFQNGNGGEVVLNLDGAEIARSKRFVSEVNRKNAGLSLR